MKRSVQFALSLVVVVTTGCSTTLGTKYFKYHAMGWGGGHEIKSIGQDRYSVVYAGTDKPTAETVQTYWLYRASTLAIETGFWGFEILELDSPLVLTRYREANAKNDCDFAWYPGSFNYPAYRGVVQLVKSPPQARSSRIFGAEELLRAVRPYVDGDKKCPDGNVYPHEKPYLMQTRVRASDA
jgi:hypothetical protein